MNAIRELLAECREEFGAWRILLDGVTLPAVLLVILFAAAFLLEPIR